MLDMNADTRWKSKRYTRMCTTEYPQGSADAVMKSSDVTFLHHRLQSLPLSPEPPVPP